MSESALRQIDVSPLRQAVRPPIEFLASRLLADVGDNLVSLTVVGSATTDDFHPKRSDINTVMVVARRSHQLLQLIAGYGKTMGVKKLRAPLLMTAEYLQQSLDVFAVELLDFQLSHVTVFGDDPFAGLTFQQEHVRHQCERQLKAALIKLRQGYISVLGKSKLVGDLLIACIGELLVLLRAMLWLTDAERPAQADATLRVAGEKFTFDTRTISQLVACKQQRSRPSPDQVEQMFQEVYLVIDQLARHVDQIGTKNDK